MKKNHRQDLAQKPPIISVKLTIQEIVGEHDYSLFMEMLDWHRHHNTEDSARDLSAYHKKYGPGDRDWYSKTLAKVQDHGFFHDGDRWLQRSKSSVDMMFEDDKTYGGVPPMSVLITLSPAELRKMIHKSGFKL